MPGTELSASLTHTQQEELEQRLRTAARENRIQCAAALAIAKALGVTPAEVGKTANKLKIRISKCQLGCF